MAKPIINQTAHLEQLLKELAHRTCKMGEQVESLKKHITVHLATLNHRLDKERHQSRKFILNTLVDLMKKIIIMLFNMLNIY